MDGKEGMDYMPLDLQGEALLVLHLMPSKLLKILLMFGNMKLFNINFHFLIKSQKIKKIKNKKK